MAQRIESYGSSRGTSGDPPRRKKNIPGKYPWDDYLDGSWWLIRRYPDFPESMPNSFRHAAMNAATRRGIKVTTAIPAAGEAVRVKIEGSWTSVTSDGNIVLLRAYSPGEE